MIGSHKTKLTYPPAASAALHFRPTVSPQDQDHGYGWTLEGFSVGMHINHTPVESSGQRRPSHLNSDVFWN